MSTQIENSQPLTEADGPGEQLDQDDVFHILQCRRRRLVLKYMQERDGPADMRDVTERIAAVENDTTVAQLRSQERQRVYIALYQSHLPKMDRDGVVDYDQDRGTVERTARTDAFEPYLVNEPTLFPDEGRKDEPRGAGDDESGERDGEPSERAPTDETRRSVAGWRRLSLAATGGGLAIAASVYAADTSAFVALAVAATLACASVLLVAGSYLRRSGDQADA